MDVSRDKAVLVSLEIRRWEVNTHDASASREVARRKRLEDPSLVRLWKSRMPKNKFVSAISGAAATARKLHYDNTFPWAQEGARLLPTRNYVDYMALMHKAKAHFWKSVDEFIREFDRLKTMAQKSLKTMYKESDYPSVDSLRSSFGFKTLVLAVPAGEMLTADIPAEEIDRVRADIEQSVQQAFRDANRDLWDRLYGMIRRFQERLSDPKYMREDSLTGMREMLQLLDRLNVTGDERLEELRKQAENRLGTLSIEDFKEKDSPRRTAALEDARRIEQAMAAFMGNVPNGG